jgi:hypothetical protein
VTRRRMGFSIGLSCFLAFSRRISSRHSRESGNPAFLLLAVVRKAAGFPLSRE